MLRIKTVWFSGCLFTPIYILFLFIYFINDLSVRMRLTNQDHPVVPESESGCELPKLDPFDFSIWEATNNTPFPIICETDEYPLLFKTDLDSNLIMLKPQGDDCCYKKLIRANDSDIDFSFDDRCTAIRNTTTKIPEDYEYIGVFCKTQNISASASSASTSTTDTPEYYEDNDLRVVDILGLTRLKPEVEERIENGEHNPDGFSILILGLDAMSHMNLLRTMPKTHKYITENLGAISMNGFGSVGTNTFPNLMASLTGLTPHELTGICRPYPTAGFDTCPLIWNNFSSQGFRTSYVEDTPNMVTFNYIKEGFLTPPTDYYLRPLMQAQSELMGHTPGGTGAANCHGPRLCFDIVLNKVQEMAQIMKTRKYFQFAWSNSLTHDFIDLPQIIDDPVHELFKNLKENGHLEKTVVIFLSDHGLRYGDVRTTRQGQMEFRMPFLYVILPEAFSVKYPIAAKNLSGNKNRLVSPFDLYATLSHLLIMDDNANANVSSKGQMGDLKGISLFEPIPINRSCELARIPPHFCVCNALKPIPVNRTVVLSAAEHYVSYVNEKFKDFPQCENLTLKSVTEAYFLLRKQTTMHMNRDFNDNDDFVGHPVDIRLTVETVPGNALFEVTVSRNIAGKWTVASDSRISMYLRQSQCIDSDPDMKSYCYCKEL